MPDIEFKRSSTGCTQRRTHRTAESIPPPVATFDPYTNDPWAMKHRALGHFQQAAMRVILQLRVEAKRRMIRKLIENYRTGKAGREPSGKDASFVRIVQGFDDCLLDFGEGILKSVYSAASTNLRFYCTPIKC